MEAGLLRWFSFPHSIFSLPLKGVELLLFNSPLVPSDVFSSVCIAPLLLYPNL